LNATKTAARTVVFQDAKGRAGFLICKSVTLAEMADLLATPALFPEGKIVRALNLDGGSSTALLVRGDPPFYQREWKSVRNYLAIVPRP
jgi:exopolysaccharide biosynthesis protein